MMELIKFSEYYSIGQNDEELNEGIKKWLAIFMILMQLGMVPASVMAGTTQDKMEYVQSLPKSDLDLARFINYLNKNKDKVSTSWRSYKESKVEEVFNEYKKKTGISGSFEDYWDKIDYDSEKGEFKYEIGAPTENYEKWMETVEPRKEIGNTFFVSDYGEVIEDGLELRMNTRLHEFEKKTDVEVAILTIPSLNGEVIEKYGGRTADRWGVGKAETDNGVFILMSRQDRKIHIFTGYGIGGVLTDYTCGRLVDNVFIPHAKEGDYSGGFDALVNAIMEEVGTDEQIEAKKERLEKERIEFARKVGNFFIILAEILAVLSVSYLFYRLIKRRLGKIRELKVELNEQIVRLNRMGATIDRIDSSNIIKESEQIEKVKNYLNTLIDEDDFRTSRKSIDELDKNLDKLGKEYNTIIRHYNSIVKSLKYIKKVEDDNKLISPKYSNKIKEINKNLIEFVEKIKRTDIDISEFDKYEKYVSDLSGVENKLSKLKSIFNTIESEDNRFSEVKKSLLWKVERSIGAIKDIESMGYSYDNPKVSDREVERMEDMFNNVRSIYKDDIIKAYNLFTAYNQTKDRLVRRSGAIINYDDYIKSTKSFVDNYTTRSIEQTIDDINDYKYDDWRDDELMKTINKKLELLKELLRNPVDFILVKERIDEVEEMVNDEFSRVDGEYEDEEERKRKKRRKKKKKSSGYGGGYGGVYGGGYSSGYSSSSTSSSSGFGGFGGGSFGGGGAGGSW